MENTCWHSGTFIWVFSYSHISPSIQFCFWASVRCRLTSFRVKDYGVVIVNLNGWGQVLLLEYMLKPKQVTKPTSTGPRIFSNRPELEGGPIGSFQGHPFWVSLELHFRFLESFCWYQISASHSSDRAVPVHVSSVLQTDAFQKPVPLEQHPDYAEYIFHPMDLCTLEKVGVHERAS